MLAGLSRRSTEVERMDTDCVDYADYRSCLSDLARVNRVTRTHRPALDWLARETQGMPSFALLDVGCGHGDMLRRIRRWSASRGMHARLDGIDLNPWATRAAEEATPPDAEIHYRTGDIFAPGVAEEPYDFIISTQFAHHLDDSQLVAFIRWMEARARRGWFIGDLHRHWFAYYGFPLLARAAGWHRFIRQDGQVSIARAFVPADWTRLLAAAGVPSSAARICWSMPFRLCVERHCNPR